MGASVVFGEGLAGCGSDFFEADGRSFSRSLAKSGSQPSCIPSLAAALPSAVCMNSMYCTCSFGGAVDDGGNGFGNVIVGYEFEFVEGGEEMIVAGFVSGAPVAHGPGVDDLAVEDMVVVGAADRGLRRVVLAGVARRGEQTRGRPVDAEIVGGGPVDHVFGVDRAVEMVVQVSALGHVVQEGEQQRRLVADGVEIAGGFLFGRLGRGQRGYQDEEHGELQAHERASGNQEGNCNAGAGIWTGMRKALTTKGTKVHEEDIRSLASFVILRAFVVEGFSRAGIGCRFCYISF